jgi:hypothetical protein
LRLDATTDFLITKGHPNAAFVAKQPLVQLAFVIYILVGYVLWLLWMQEISTRSAAFALLGLLAFSNITTLLCNVPR